jgi:dUTPase
MLFEIWSESTIVPARGRAVVKTDLSISIPENTYARIAPRFVDPISAPNDSAEVDLP